MNTRSTQEKNHLLTSVKDMGHVWRTQSGTVFRVFETHELNELDASGQKPVFSEKNDTIVEKKSKLK